LYLAGRQEKAQFTVGERLRELAANEPQPTWLLRGANHARREFASEGPGLVHHADAQQGSRLELPMQEQADTAAETSCSRASQVLFVSNGDPSRQGTASVAGGSP